jgi:hypothetical protein
VFSLNTDTSELLNIISFFHPHNYYIFLYVVYILQHVSAVRGHRQVIYIHFFYIKLALFLATPTWPMFTLMEVEGVVYPLVFVFSND